MVDAVRSARGSADTVVVYLHRGTEDQGCPNASHPPLAAMLIDAGADIVVGTTRSVLGRVLWRLAWRPTIYAERGWHGA
jgi:poly-gamma-glutamate synthesis protein (capsule biosynthesis protein)